MIYFEIFFFVIAVVIPDEKFQHATFWIVEYHSGKYLSEKIFQTIFYERIYSVKSNDSVYIYLASLLIKKGQTFGLNVAPELTSNIVSIPWVAWKEQIFTILFRFATQCALHHTDDHISI